MHFGLRAVEPQIEMPYPPVSVFLELFSHAICTEERCNCLNRQGQRMVYIP